MALVAMSRAGDPVLVRDLNPYGGYPAEITVVGTKIFFASGDLEHGDELWCYDGTRSARVADLQAGPSDFQPADLVALGGRIYFRGGIAGRERELWSSDGTAAGTRLVMTLPGEATRIEGMRAAGELLFLRVLYHDGIEDPFQIWVSDGTPAGTKRLLVEGVDSFEAFAPVAVGSRFYFTASIGRELWVTDGTAANTLKLATSDNPSRGDLVRTSTGSVYIAWDELWVSDGTVAGTREVAEVNPGAAGSFPFNLIPLGAQLVFFATDDSHGHEPWITDGTTAGTRRLRDIAEGAASGIPSNSYVNYDGTIIPTWDTVPAMIGAAGGRAFFSNSSTAEGWELWATDGTTAGTARVVDLLSGAYSSAPLNFAAVGDRIVFVATGPGTAGRELWISDGTAQGTQLLADLAAGPEESRAEGFVPYGNGLVFRAYDGQGTKLWFTDGTRAGTRLLDGRFSNSYDGSYSELKASGGTLFFNFSDDGGETLHLGTSDGTTAQTRRTYGPIPTSLDPDGVSWTGYTIFPLGGGEVLWTPWADGLGTELWFSDGSFGGTGLVYDFSTETGMDASSPTGFARLGDDVFFSAYLGVQSGRAYYRFNVRDLSVTPAVLGEGTAALGGYGYSVPRVAGGRVFVNRITGRRPPLDWRVYMSRPGETPVQLTGIPAAGLYPSARDFTAFRGRTFFSLPRDTIPELWENDGTAEGNSRFAPHPDGQPVGVVNDKLLILDGATLFSSDGTAEGTSKLVEAQSPVMLAMDARRAFLIDRGSVGEPALWVTDGSSAGTRRLRSFEQAALHETTRGVLAQGILFFRARSTATGAELWRSDGTEEGTRIVSDLWPGAGDGATEQIAATSDGRVFFVGRTPSYGWELFAVPRDALAAVLPSDVSLAASSHSAAPGASVTLTAELAPGYSAPRWQRNGATLAGSASSSLVFAELQPGQAGLYTAQAASTTGTAISSPTMVGVTSTVKVIGTGVEVTPANLKHPNGNVYDQLLATGAATSITADWASNQVSRISFIDPNDDIVQVEFAGPGTLTLLLDGAGAAARPRNYSQAVEYVKGRAALVITGADERTHVSAFCVGRATAFDPTGGFDFTRPMGPDNDPANNGSPLFQGHGATPYDGMADLAFVAIASRNGRFGGVRTGNVRYSASAGVTGIFAPGVVFEGPINVGNLSASGTAQPMLIVGRIGEVRMAGGDALQANGLPVQLSGVTLVRFTSGSDAHGRPIQAKGSRAQFEEAGENVTQRVIVNP